MMNFVAVREDNCYYVNKTHYISLIERANKFFFLIRFRRFGADGQQAKRIFVLCCLLIDVRVPGYESVLLSLCIES